MLKKSRGRGGDRLSEEKLIDLSSLYLDIEKTGVVSVVLLLPLQPTN